MRRRTPIAALAFALGLLGGCRTPSTGPLAAAGRVGPVARAAPPGDPTDSLSENARTAVIPLRPPSIVMERTTEPEVTPPKPPRDVRADAAKLAPRPPVEGRGGGSSGTPTPL